jgi:Flp pilus assembly protein TadD
MYLDAGEAARAMPHLEYLDAREQKTPAYASELARRYAAQREMGRAVVKAERATQLAPYDARPRELAATVAIQAGELQTAERHILALTALEPDRAIHRERLEAVRKRIEAEEGR